MGRKKVENKLFFNVKGFEVTKEWLEDQLNNGSTDSEVSRKLGVSREYVRQIKEYFNIKINKGIIWKAKKYGIEGLSREFLISKFKEYGTVGKIANNLGVSSGVVAGFMRYFNLKVEDIKGSKVFLGSCSFCGKEIKRKEYRIRVNQNLFCSKQCNGRFISLSGRNKRSEISDYTCVVCGKEFKRKVNLVRVGQNNFYCSPECYSKK